MKTPIAVFLLGNHILGGILTTSAFSSPLKGLNRHTTPPISKTNNNPRVGGKVSPLSQSASADSSLLESDGNGEEEGKQGIPAATFSLVKATVGSGVLSLSCKKIAA